MPRTPNRLLEDLWPALAQGDPQAVHEARKLTRKVAAELKLGDAPKKTRRAWRDLRRAVAPLRDRDVAFGHIGEALDELGQGGAGREAFAADWGRQRAEAVAALKLPKVPTDAPRPKHLGRRAREALTEQAGELLASGPGVLKARRPDTWHEWRKALKNYRYTLELLREPPDALKAVLDSLGRLQDAEVVLDILEHEPWLEGARADLIARERRIRLESRKEVRAQWPALEAHLNRVLETGGRKD
ncbi:CHAD domain-containing protein [Deinococcus gobiensis]|uniref:CHAD domain-containing protein n=1 Tax=Deinococcus gobiensis (strain DSM 21396 / JCM 16679 / CGMCC 1.7299 / I-0) TaxID=745776 RepID=H8GYZ2_DEIGI|nr:CHAD domain-containing protein [Deinococcus gobiensis]AFD24919.1 CHAD domain-containing protein [Deinococcus gobiensis I-0]